MKWITAALAFALIMLVLATVVTIILESAYKLLLTREKGFRLMMARMFDEVLKPRVGHLLRGVTLGEARERFLDAVTRNQAYEKDRGAVLSRVQSDQLASMTMMQFADRLADTDVGRAIARGGTEYVENAINDLAQKFERFGAIASRRFQDHARFWCVSASLVLAFVANVDAIRLAQSLVSDQSLTDAVIAQYGESVGDDASRPRDAAEALKTMAELKRNGDITEDEFKAFKETLAGSQAKLTELRNLGLPITTAAWPFCASEADGATPDRLWDTKCRGVARSATGPGAVWSRLWNSEGHGIGWILSVTLAGALIGLGAPFWFDLARGLSRVARFMGLTGGTKESDKAPPPPDARSTPPPGTPVEAFKVAIAAARPPRARILLTSRGQPMRGVKV